MSNSQMAATLPVQTGDPPSQCGDSSGSGLELQQRIPQSLEDNSFVSDTADMEELGDAVIPSSLSVDEDLDSYLDDNHSYRALTNDDEGSSLTHNEESKMADVSAVSNEDRSYGSELDKLQYGSTGEDEANRSIMIGVDPAEVIRDLNNDTNQSLFGDTLQVNEDNSEGNNSVHVEHELEEMEAVVESRVDEIKKVKISSLPVQQTEEHVYVEPTVPLASHVIDNSMENDDDNSHNSLLDNSINIQGSNDLENETITINDTIQPTVILTDAQVHDIPQTMVLDTMSVSTRSTNMVLPTQMLSTTPQSSPMKGSMHIDATQAICEPVLYAYEAKGLQRNFDRMQHVNMKSMSQGDMRDKDEGSDGMYDDAHTQAVELFTPTKSQQHTQPQHHHHTQQQKSSVKTNANNTEHHDNNTEELHLFSNTLSMDEEEVVYNDMASLPQCKNTTTAATSERTLKRLISTVSTEYQFEGNVPAHTPAVETTQDSRCLEVSQQGTVVAPPMKSNVDPTIMRKGLTVSHKQVASQPEATHAYCQQLSFLSQSLQGSQNEGVMSQPVPTDIYNDKHLEHDQPQSKRRRLDSSRQYSEETAALRVKPEWTGEMQVIFLTQYKAALEQQSVDQSSFNQLLNASESLKGIRGIQNKITEIASTTVEPGVLSPMEALLHKMAKEEQSRTLSLKLTKHKKLQSKIGNIALELEPKPFTLDVQCVEQQGYICGCKQCTEERKLLANLRKAKEEERLKVEDQKRRLEQQRKVEEQLRLKEQEEARVKLEEERAAKRKEAIEKKKKEQEEKKRLADEKKREMEQRKQKKTEEDSLRKIEEEAAAKKEEERLIREEEKTRLLREEQQQQQAEEHDRLLQEQQQLESSITSSADLINLAQQYTIDLQDFPHWNELCEFVKSKVVGMKDASADKQVHAVKKDQKLKTRGITTTNTTASTPNNKTRSSSRPQATPTTSRPPKEQILLADALVSQRTVEELCAAVSQCYFPFLDDMSHLPSDSVRHKLSDAEPPLLERDVDCAGVQFMLTQVPDKLKPELEAFCGRYGQVQTRLPECAPMVSICGAEQRWAVCAGQIQWQSQVQCCKDKPDRTTKYLYSKAAKRGYWVAKRGDLSRETLLARQPSQVYGVPLHKRLLYEYCFYILGRDTHEWASVLQSAGAMVLNFNLPPANEIQGEKVDYVTTKTELPYSELECSCVPCACGKPACKACAYRESINLLGGSLLSLCTRSSSETKQLPLILPSEIIKNVNLQCPCCNPTTVNSSVDNSFVPQTEKLTAAIATTILPSFSPHTTRGKVIVLVLPENKTASSAQQILHRCAVYNAIQAQIPLVTTSWLSLSIENGTMLPLEGSAQYKWAYEQ